MTTPKPATVYPAELLKDLVERFLAGSPWTREQRKDAWLLVTLLCTYSVDLEMERKLWDDTDAAEALGPPAARIHP